MREIKFRAWDKATKKMWYSSTNGGYGSLIPFFETVEAAIEDDSAILMQYTGLKDKNGKEIYEGDIVKIKDLCDNDVDAFVGYVSYDNASFYINQQGVSHYRWIDYVVEIIGNIYENPELLTKGEGDAQLKRNAQLKKTTVRKD